MGFQKKNEKHTKPVPLQDWNELRFVKVVDLCEEYFNDLNSSNFNESRDYDSGIVEAVIEVIYGKSALDWVNNKME